MIMDSKKNEQNQFSYSEEKSIELPTQDLPLPQTLSSEAKEWLSGLYRQAFGVDAKEHSVHQKFNSHVESVIEQLKLEEKKQIDLGDILISDVVIEGVRCKTINNSKPKDKNTISVIFLIDDQVFLGRTYLNSAIYLCRVFSFDIVVPMVSQAGASERADLVQKLSAIAQQTFTHASDQRSVVIGEGNGANLAASMVVSLYQQEWVMPNAVALIGISGLIGDSNYQNAFLDVTNLENLKKTINHEEVNKHELDVTTLQDPIIDPFCANMEIFPPTLFITGTRDCDFSSSLAFHREMKRAGNHTKLIAFDGLPKAYQLFCGLPESQETFKYLYKFAMS